MNVRIWNLQKRQYEQAEVVSVSNQNIVVSVEGRRFPIQPRDVDPDDRNRLAKRAADLLPCGHSVDSLGNFGGCNPMGSCVICDSAQSANANRCASLGKVKHEMEFIVDMLRDAAMERDRLEAAQHSAQRTANYCSECGGMGNSHTVMCSQWGK